MARGLAITLVVVGHVNAGLVGAQLVGDASGFLGQITAWIYSFHMPVFFVLAGALAHQSLARHGRLTFVRGKATGLLYPYFVWGTVQTLAHVALSGVTNTPTGPRELARLLYDPPMQFWFLPCLFGMFVLFAGCVPPGDKGLTFVLASLVVALGLSQLNVPPECLPGRFRDNVLYFAAGVAAAGPLTRWAGLSAPLALVAAATGGLLSVAAVEWERARQPPVSLVIPFAGIVFLFAAALLVSRVTVVRKPLAALGRLSLEVYLAHVLAYAGVRIIMSRGFGVTDVGIQWVAGVGAGLGLPVALALASQRFGFGWVFTCPRRALLVRGQSV